MNFGNFGNFGKVHWFWAYKNYFSTPHGSPTIRHTEKPTNQSIYEEGWAHHLIYFLAKPP